MMQVELLRKKLDERNTELESLRNGQTARNKSERVWQTPIEIKGLETYLGETPRDMQDVNEYVTLSVAAEAERQRLLELVTLLNRRVDKERTDTDHISVGYFFDS